MDEFQRGQAHYLSQRSGTPATQFFETSYMRPLSS